MDMQLCGFADLTCGENDTMKLGGVMLTEEFKVGEPAYLFLFYLNKDGVTWGVSNLTQF